MSELSNSTQKLVNFSAKLFAGLFAAILVAAIFIFMFPHISHHLILFIGAGMMFYSLRILKRYGDLQSWNLEKARIENIREITDEQADGSFGTMQYFYPEIAYQYTVNGEIYNSKAVSLEKQNIWCAESNIWGESLTANEKWWSGLKVGYELSAYINPENPEDSVLIRNLKDSRRSHHIAILYGGILICLLWLLVVLLKI